MESRVWKGLGILFIASVTSEVVYLILKRTGLISAFGSRRRRDDLELLFFPDSQVACRTHFTSRHGCHNQRCRFSHDQTLSYSRLMNLLASTRKSIDLCIYTITSAELADIIIQQFHRGVRVRVIIDDENIEAMGSQVEKFRSEGIQVRHDNSPYLMHHKFVVLDGLTLVSGSFNWTRQAIMGNWENLMVTSNTDVLQPFTQQFDHLWKQFDPEKQTPAPKMKST